MSDLLAAQILRRKSFRSFREDPLDPALLEELVDFLSDLNPPEPDIDWNFDTLPYKDMVKLCMTEPGIKNPVRRAISTAPAKNAPCFFS